MISLKRIKDFAILILIGILLFASWKGCENNKLQTATVLKLDSLMKKSEQDSIKMYQDSIQYADHIQYVDGKLELNYTQYITAYDSLHNAELRINRLIAKHKPIVPVLDTSIMQVPTEYVAECSQCFGELSNSKYLAGYFKLRADSLLSSFREKESEQEKRIKKLDGEKNTLQNTLNICKGIAKESMKLHPQRKVLLSLGVLGVNSYTPTGAGIGAMYQDKKNQLFGGMVYATNVGTIYQAQVSIPLSLKRKK